MTAMMTREEAGREAVKALGYVKAMARRFCGGRPHYDDMVQEGAAALVRCFQTVRPGTGTPLSYARKSIKGAMVDYLRANVVRRLPVAPFPLEHLPERQGGTAPAPACFAEVEALLPRLGEKEREAVIAVCFDGLSYGRAAVRVGVKHRKNVQVLLLAAAQHLRFGLEHPEYEGELSQWPIRRYKRKRGGA